MSVALYTLVKYFWISCAHSVPGAGKCERTHGHNYKVKFCVKGTRLNAQAMLIDFRKVKHALMDRFDHRLLNETPEFNLEQGGFAPSTEKVAEVFFGIISSLCDQEENRPKLQWVEIEETNEAYARFEMGEF